MAHFPFFFFSISPQVSAHPFSKNFILFFLSLFPFLIPPSRHTGKAPPAGRLLAQRVQTHPVPDTPPFAGRLPPDWREDNRVLTFFKLLPVPQPAGRKSPSCRTYSRDVCLFLPPLVPTSFPSLLCCNALPTSIFSIVPCHLIILPPPFLLSSLYEQGLVPSPSTSDL